MKKIIALTFTLFSAWLGFSQTLYVPNGTGGISTSSNGNVGIGISNPDQKLEVNGRIRAERIMGPKTSNLIIQGQDIGGGNGYGLEFYAVQNGIDFKTFAGSWTSRLYIQDNGYVGINNPSPSTQFDVNGDIATSGRLISPRISGTSAGNLIIQGQDVGGGNGYGLEFYAVQNGIDFKTFAGSWSSRFYIQDNGNVGIGTNTPDNDALLTVAGSIHSTEVKVLINAGSGPDYVFESDYELRSLQKTKEYITENKHLPEIPTAREMEANGIDLGDMNMRLLKKIEELTLYQIELLEKLEQQSEQLLEQKEQIMELKTSNARIDELEKKLLELMSAEK